MYIETTLLDNNLTNILNRFFIIETHFQEKKNFTFFNVEITFFDIIRTEKLKDFIFLQLIDNTSKYKIIGKLIINFKINVKQSYFNNSLVFCPIHLSNQL